MIHMWSTALSGPYVILTLNDSSRRRERSESPLFNRRSGLAPPSDMAELEALDDFDSFMELMYAFMRPDQPFSGFVFAYFSRLMSGPSSGGE